MNYTIRYRERRGRPREAFGEYVEWSEWQVVCGRKVIARFDFEHQAALIVAEIERLDREGGE